MTFLFIHLLIEINNTFLKSSFRVQSVKQALCCITQTIRVQVSWTKIYFYTSQHMLHNCQTSGQWFTTKTVYLPLNAQGNVRGMHRFLSWLSNCRATFQLISVQHKQQTHKNPSFQTAPPLPASFLKQAPFPLIAGVFCTVCVCPIKFFHVTSCKGQTTHGVKEYPVFVSRYFPN